MSRREPRGEELPAHLDSDAESETPLAVLSGVARKGAWEPAERMRVFAVMGGVEIQRKKQRRWLRR